MSTATSQVAEQQLTFDEWTQEILPAVLGIPMRYAMSSAKLDFAAYSLTLPSLKVGGRPLYEGFAAKGAAQIAALVRGRVVRHCNSEVALATGVRYLEKNGLALHMPPHEALRLDQLIHRVGDHTASETELASFLEPFVTVSSEPSPFKTPRLIVYLTIAETVGGPERRASLYGKVDRSALAVVSTHPEPIDLAVTAPGQIDRQPEEDWQTRRGAIIRGDRDPGGAGLTAPAGGMIAITSGPGDITLGLELAKMGPRAPVLLLHPFEEAVPPALEGYARTEGNVAFASFSDDEDIVASVGSFIGKRLPEMLRLARARRDAAVVSTPLQHRLRHRVMRLSPLEMKAVLAHTGFTEPYLLEMITEPAAYSRAEGCDICALANALGEPLEDHVSRPSFRPLSRRQYHAFRIAARRRKLPQVSENRLRERGEALVAYPHGRAGLGEPEDWEALLVGDQQDDA